ncbi:MAG: hypothetical protein JXA10_07905 [Anaerolineae bacterium]|nr:hypothetical protein [Anaerolineae bacterium]
MTVIPAENVEIVIREGTWRILSSGQSLTPDILFQVTRGGGVIEYADDYGRDHHLPGTVLSVNYVRAVVIGYEENSRCWKLGFHVARNDQEKARWLELVRWLPSDNDRYAQAAQQAGRELAEHIGCPLKVFGAKKLPQRPPSSKRSGVTGPLVPHKREDIGPQRVKLFAQSVNLPVQYPGIWLGRSRGEVTLRLTKDVIDKSGGKIAPSFNQCIIDPEKGKIRLLPPTGLLGSIFGGSQGREIRSDLVQNIELRHTITRDFESTQDTDGTLTEITHLHYAWEIFLTLPDEGILLAQTTHSTSSDLARKRSMVGNKFSVNTKSGIEYLRQHQADQEAYEAAETFARTVAVVIASALSVRLVKTESNGAES